MKRKKELIAKISSSLGFTRLLEIGSGASSLLILNYHRVGNGHESPYDSGLYSCTTADFDCQIGFIKDGHSAGLAY